MQNRLIKPLMLLLFTGSLALGAAAEEVWSGGVGEAERANAPERNTRVEFFVDGGSYLAGVDYTLFDARGERIAEGRADGPWLLVDLDRGDYSVRAERPESGAVQSVRFSVGDGDTRVGLKFAN